jgi:hypothetical protein
MEHVQKNHLSDTSHTLAVSSNRSLLLARSLTAAPPTRLTRTELWIKLLLRSHLMLLPRQ